jgi:hypothetical protein
MKRNGCIYAVIISIFFVSFYAHGDGLGYKPVPDNEYNKWCEETFDNGEQIYRAYKNIAFNVKYTPEEDKADFWQTPKETSELKKGDCEDAVFLFFSKISAVQDAKIIWGWVIDKKTNIGKAHVWYQLTDKNMRQYVVEGFSNDWNGIIPIEIISDSETRIPILSITHRALIKLSNLASGFDSLQTFKELAWLHSSIDYIESGTETDYGDVSGKYDRVFNFGFVEHQEDGERFDLLKIGLDRQIYDIFMKLHELFERMRIRRNSK